MVASALSLRSAGAKGQSAEEQPCDIDDRKPQREVLTTCFLVAMQLHLIKQVTKGARKLTLHFKVVQGRAAHRGVLAMMKVFHVQCLVFFLSQVLDSIWSILDSAPTKYASKSGLFRTCAHPAACHAPGTSLHATLRCVVCRAQIRREQKNA